MVSDTEKIVSDTVSGGRATRRLFFAVWPPPEVRRQLRRRCAAAVRASGGQPVPPANYHLTLAFLGNVPAGQYPRLLEAAATVTPPAGELCLERLGYWSRPRVLWIAPEEPVAELARVAAELWAALEPLGIAPETRPFQPHLTLARKVARAPAANRLERPVCWMLRGFVLVESVTHPRGARYTVTAAFPPGSCPEP